MTRRSVVAAYRLVVVGGVLAFRALFNWTAPAAFVSTLIAGPLFELLFIVYIGRWLVVENDAFFVVGNAVAAASSACVFGGMMALANEHRYGTLAAVLLSARGRVALLLGRGLPYVVIGFGSALTTLLIAGLTLPIGLRAATLAPIVASMAAGAASCTAFGLVLGTLGLRFRDVWVLSNTAAALLLLLTGAAVPRSLLPDWLRAAGGGLPLTHAIEAARRASAGAGWAELAGPLLREGLVLVAYGVVLVGAVRLLEAWSRRTGALPVT